MAQITFKGNPIHTSGDLPKPGSAAPAFSLTRGDLSTVTLEDLQGKKAVLNIFPSIDTPVCAASVKRFNEAASNAPGTVVVCISKDLPFAQKRFCAAEGLSNVVCASEYKDDGFGRAYGVRIADGPLAGLFARAVVVLDPNGKVVYSEQVPEIAQEPDYEKALAALK